MSRLKMIKKRFRRFADDQAGNIIMYAMASTFVLILLSGAIAQSLIFASRGAYRTLHRMQALYLAEAGIMRTWKEFQDGATDLTALLVGADGIPDTADDGILSFGTNVSLGDGNYSVVLADNDDGDGNSYVDADDIVLVTSTGSIPAQGVTKTLQAYMEVVAPAGGGVSMRATIVAAGPVDTLGTLTVDGRDHDMVGNLIPGSGTLGISTLITCVQSGNSQVGGTVGGTDYAPSKPADPAVIEEAADWSAEGGFPDPEPPDNVLGLAPGTLMAIAQSGENGSQYVNDPANLTFPLSGVTYVELPAYEGDFGLIGGHFDVDVFDSPTTSELYHEHEFDDKFNVTYIDIMNDPKLLFNDVIGPTYPNNLRLEFYNAHNGSGAYTFTVGGSTYTGVTQSGFEITFHPSLMTALRVDFASLEDLRDSDPGTVQGDIVDRDDAFSVRMYDVTTGELVYELATYHHVKDDKKKKKGGGGGGGGSTPSPSIWQSIEFGDSEGILIVHNSTTNTVMKNLNGGTFTGLIIADDIVHIHNNIIGMVYVLTPTPSSGNCIGNGNGSVLYSNQAISNATQSAFGATTISMKSWFY
ncbi:MAG: hypothetical protein O7E52_06510 [Candidatus Poribacteria bacterium]|nr:hypothetical protein [Candidatus Poribacteria bacterium]